MKTLLQFISYLFLRLVCLVMTLLPVSVSYGAARTIGWLGFHVLRFRRKIVMDNLEIAFGREMSREEIRKLAARSYVQIAMTFMELMISPKLQKHIEQILDPEQKQLIRDLLARGNGLVTVSGHLGNWELQGAAAATILKEPFSVAAVEQSNPYINSFVIKRREELGMQAASFKGAMKLLVRSLKNKQAIGLVADQNAGWTAVFVDFFGKSAATHAGPAHFALKYNAPLLVGAAIRTGPGQFRVLAEEVEISENETAESLTQKHVKILEKFIRQYPDQYFWMHRRWKTRPSDHVKMRQRKLEKKRQQQMELQ